MAGGVCPQLAAGSCDPGSTLSSPQDRSGLVGAGPRHGDSRRCYPSSLRESHTSLGGEQGLGRLRTLENVATA